MSKKFIAPNKNKLLEKFKLEYLRICTKFGVDSINSRTFDHDNTLISRRVLSRELGMTFNGMVFAVGLKVHRHHITEKESKKLNEDILRLRLEGNSYMDISLNLDIDLTCTSIRRRLIKIYDNSPDEIKLKLDKILEKTKKGRYWKYI